VERSSDQVIKPVNLEALSKWVGSIPDDVVKDMADIAPMLSVLGYDPYANPPNYGKPDEVVAINTKDIQKHKGDWEKKPKKCSITVGKKVEEEIQHSTKNPVTVQTIPRDNTCTQLGVFNSIVCGRGPQSELNMCVKAASRSLFNVIVTSQYLNYI
jgi:hypothetical protein